MSRTIKFTKQAVQLLNERYKGGKIAALNGQRAEMMRNREGNYCLIGAMVDDATLDRKLIHRNMTDECYEKMWDSIIEGDEEGKMDNFYRLFPLHDPYSDKEDKTPLIQTIETIIETGELTVFN